MHYSHRCGNTIFIILMPYIIIHWHTYLHTSSEKSNIHTVMLIWLQYLGKNSKIGLKNCSLTHGHKHTLSQWSHITFTNTSLQWHTHTNTHTPIISFFLFPLSFMETAVINATYAKQQMFNWNYCVKLSVLWTECQRRSVICFCLCSTTKCPTASTSRCTNRWEKYYLLCLGGFVLSDCCWDT